MLLAVLPLIARMVVVQDPTYYTAAVVMTAVFLFTVLYGRDFGNAVFESVKNTYENEVLVEQLVAEKRMAETRGGSGNRHALEDSVLRCCKPRSAATSAGDRNLCVAAEEAGARPARAAR